MMSKRFFAVNAPSSLARDRPNLHEAEPGYVLHNHPFKETSLVVEVFTRNVGRLGLVAKGARRPRSALRGTLMAFQPLLLYWSGKSELRLLHRAEWQGGQPQMAGLALICGFYLNELVLKLTQRDDPHAGLYSGYEDALAGLRCGHAPGAVLRRFERRMLADLGYGLTLTEDVEGCEIDPAANYVYIPERGALPLPPGQQPGAAGLQILGRTLLDMARDEYSDPLTAQQSRAIMRLVINHHLGGQTLHTRQLLREAPYS
jgi:DNA repair protein RecO (recombination protein O)